MVLLKILNSDNNPKDKEAKIEIIPTIINKITLDFNLENLNFSINVAHGASKMLIPEVRAAQNNKTNTHLPP